MLRRLNFDADDLALSLALWICSLPFIALIVFPAFGLKIAGLPAVAFPDSMLGHFSPAFCSGAKLDLNR